MPSHKSGPAFIVTFPFVLLFLFPYHVMRQILRQTDTSTSGQNLQHVSWLYGPGLWSSWLMSALGAKTRHDPFPLSLTWTAVYFLLAVFDLVDCLSASHATEFVTAEFNAALAVVDTGVIIFIATTWIEYHRVTWSRRFFGFFVTYLCYTASWNNICIHTLRSDLWTIPLCSLIATQIFYLPWLLDPSQLQSIKAPWTWHGLAVLVYGVLPILLLFNNFGGWSVPRENMTSLYDKFEWTYMIPQTGKRLSDPVQQLALLTSILNLFVYRVDDQPDWMTWKIFGRALLSVPKKREAIDQKSATAGAT